MSLPEYLIGDRDIAVVRVAHVGLISHGELTVSWLPGRPNSPEIIFASVRPGRERESWRGPPTLQVVVSGDRDDTHV